MQQDMDIQHPQQVDTRPRSKWFRSTVQDSRQVDPPQRYFRQSVPPERLSYMAPMTKLNNSEPSSFGEATKHDAWQEVMVEEYDSIMKNQVWEVVQRHEGKKVVGSKWIYKVKRGEVQGTLRGKGVFTKGGY